jgi:4-amino-4-deoxy-L-arabinose transferase-like glycosyltransferase
MRIRTRDRTLTSLVLAIGAFALGLVAQHYFGGIRPAKTPTDGLIVYAGAAALFMIALARTPPPPSLPVWAGRGAEEAGPVRRTLATALLLLAGGFIALSLYLFRAGMGSRLSWLLYLLAMAVFLGAAYAFGSAGPSRVRPEDEGAQPRWQFAALVAILIVALGFRLWRFAELPYGMWYDEADNGLSVRQILRDPNYWPVYVSSTNLPAHFLYLIALSFRILGDSMYAIRAVAIVFGVLTVVAAYACGRELFPRRGPAFGLILAALVAVSRWDVNWSRIGMHGVTLPFFELWVVAALLRALRTGRYTSFAWAGVALGLGLCFYSPFRIFPVVVGGFALVWFWHWIRRACPAGQGCIRHAARTWALPLSLFILGGLVAFAPVAQFSLRQPEVFWDRARRISIFRSPEAQDHPASAVLNSTAKHLLMFNYRGDPNGRHNLPGAPMLDRLSGVLLVLGVLVCAVHWTRPRSVLLLAWLFLSLSGGILSTFFEAPQSLRSFGALPAAYALVCVPIDWFADEWRRVFGALSRFLPAVAMLLLLAIAIENGLIYFHYWAHDFASWAAFNPAETRMAQDIRRYREGYDLRFDPLLTAHLTTRYLVPEYDAYQHFDPATVFPLRGSDREGVMLFIAPDTQAVREHAQLLYPGVETDVFEHDSGYPVMYRYAFSRQKIQAAQGLDGRYAPLEGAGEGDVLRVDSTLDLDWSASAPLHGPLRATWTGGLLAERYGSYLLQLDAPGACWLWLDGHPVLEGLGAQQREVVLAEGVHGLQVSCDVRDAGTVRLSWREPGQDHLGPVPSHALYRASWPVGGWVGLFYPQTDETAAPALARIDRQISYYFHFLPLERPYSVRWYGRLYAPVSGRYRFAVRAVSSAWLTIDDRVAIEPTSLGQLAESEIVLDAGMHDLELGFVDQDSHSQIYLYWQPPDGPLARVPPDVLFLPSGGAWWPAR